MVLNPSIPTGLRRSSQLLRFLQRLAERGTMRREFGTS